MDRGRLSLGAPLGPTTIVGRNPSGRSPSGQYSSRMGFPKGDKGIVSLSYLAIK
jgi:hypothetical protein